MRVLAPLLCIAILFGCAACQGTATTPQGTANGTTTTSTTAAPGEKVKISFSGWGTIEENTATQENIDRFNASQDNIIVEYLLFPWEGYVTQLNTMAAAGNLPDTATMKEEIVKPWVAKDMLADISSMYSDADKPLDCITFKDSSGNPVAYSTAAENLVMFYNKDMFDAAKVAYPPTSVDQAWTWDEFVATAKKLTLDKNGKHPGEAGFDDQNITQYGCLVENLTWQLEWPCLSNGGGLFSADGSKLAIGEAASIDQNITIAGFLAGFGCADGHFVIVGNNHTDIWMIDQPVGSDRSGLVVFRSGIIFPGLGFVSLRLNINWMSLVRRGCGLGHRHCLRLGPQYSSKSEVLHRGQALADRVLAQHGIKFGNCCLVIGPDKNRPDHKQAEAEQIPADEG